MAEETNVERWIMAGIAGLFTSIAAIWAKRRVPKAREADRTEELERGMQDLRREHAEVRRIVSELQATVESYDARIVRERLTSQDVQRELSIVRQAINALTQAVERLTALVPQK